MTAESVLGSDRIEGLVAALPSWLEERRWFADKGRGIAVVELEDALLADVESDVLILAVLRITFARGNESRYLVPLAWTLTSNGADIIPENAALPLSGAFVEATNVSWFAPWLIEKMVAGSIPADGAWRFATHPPALGMISSAVGVPGVVMRAEQSNTSLRYGDTVMMKLVRRLQPGPNPDEEMMRALAGVGFDRVPPYLGGAAWRSSDGETYPIALAQAFVPNLGDGWSWMLQRIRELPSIAAAAEIGPGSPEWMLGRRTGEMHAALSRVVDPDLAPESASERSVEADVDRVQRAVEQTISLIDESPLRIPAKLRESLAAITAGSRAAALLAEGFRAEVGTQRIRVHGDYHLGQILRTPDADWAIIDFEGEPARLVAERRRKVSALKDVAGMLRSFAYARGAAERDRIAEPAIGAAWESAAREAFLDGYRTAVHDATFRLVPLQDQPFLAALAAWELDKTLYEVDYEVRNRPDWLEIPLRGLLPVVSE